jgi:hypothetical protein
MLTVQAKLHEAITFDEIEHSVLLELCEAKLEDLQGEVSWTSASEIEQLELDIACYESIIEKLKGAKLLVD